MIKDNGVEEEVILTGFIPDTELTDHYQLADVFAMPSKGEGFGIVFIEATACGTQVIAGDKDGSVDALANGELGTLINPNDIDALAKAIQKMLTQNHDQRSIQDKTKQRFSYCNFKMRLREHFTNEQKLTA